MVKPAYRCQNFYLTCPQNNQLLMYDCIIVGWRIDQSLSYTQSNWDLMLVSLLALAHLKVQQKQYHWKH